MSLRVCLIAESKKVAVVPMQLIHPVMFVHLISSYISGSSELKSIG